MGLGVGVVYVTAPQAHEPFMVMLMFVYKMFKDEARFSWRGDVVPRRSYQITSCGIPISLTLPCMMHQTTASGDAMLVLVVEGPFASIEGSTSMALDPTMVLMTQEPDETYGMVLHTPHARTESGWRRWCLLEGSG
jgi:hypothetical protein